jgi:hypothetical protein
MLEKAKSLKAKIPKVKNVTKRGKPLGQYLVALDVGTLSATKLKSLE